MSSEKVVKGAQVKQTETPAVTTARAMSNALLDEVIRKRLIVDGDSVGDDRRIHQILKSYIGLLNNDTFPNVSEDTNTFRRLIEQLNQLEYSAKRTHGAVRALGSSFDIYNTLKEHIGKETTLTQEVIERGKLVYEEETKNRYQNMEYEALTKLIQTKPDRALNEKRKAELLRDVEKLKKEKEKLMRSLGERTMKIRGLCHAIESLKAEMESESDEEVEKDNVELMDISDTTTESLSYVVGPKELSKKENKKVLSPKIGNLNPSSSSGIITPLSKVREKYEDLSEESPEEGESQED